MGHINHCGSKSIETKLAELVVKGWNKINPVLGNCLNQECTLACKDIVGRDASTLGEVAKQTNCFAMPVARFLANKVVDFCRFAWSLAAAHPAISTSLVLVFIIIPVVREYRAANERFTFMAIPVIAWMIITRPFRLAYRMLTVMTGGTEVDRQKLVAVQRANGLLIETNDQLAEANGQLAEANDRLKTLHRGFRQELQAKQQAVLDAIDAAYIDGRDPGFCNLFKAVSNGIFEKTDEIIRDGFTSSHSSQWDQLQNPVSTDPQLVEIKDALDEWKKSLDLCILTK
jgi:hypothetical protein